MNWRNRLLCGFTLAVLMSGVMSVFQTLQGDFVAAAALIILAAILDAFDGTLARFLKATSEFGARLDTYVDTVSFGVAPAVLMYGAVCRDWGLWGYVVAGAIVIAGVLRFTRGCEAETEDPSKHCFRGLPIPVSASWMALLVLRLRTDAIDQGHALTQLGGALTLLMWVCAVVFVALQLSNVTYTKPTRTMLLVALGITIPAMLIFGRPRLIFCLATGVTLLLYVVVVPLRDRRQALADAAAEDAEAPLSS